MQLLYLPLFTTLSATPLPTEQQQYQEEEGERVPTGNLQCADEARRARIRGTLLEKYRKLVCLIEQCLSELDTTTEEPTHIYTHSFVVHVCECESAKTL